MRFVFGKTTRNDEIGKDKEDEIRFSEISVFGSNEKVAFMCTPRGCASL